MLCRVHKKPGGHSQESGLKLAKGIFHIMYRHAQSVNWEELAGGGRQQPRLGDGQRRSAGGERLCRLSFWFFPFFPFPLYYIVN